MMEMYNLHRHKWVINIYIYIYIYTKHSKWVEAYSSKQFFFVGM